MTKSLDSNHIVLFLCLFAQTGAVLCGGHHADSCAECPQGKGAAWCNGVCMWDTTTSSCMEQSVDCGSGGPSVAETETCNGCGSSADVCRGECSFNPIDSTCRPQFSNDVRTASVHLSYTVPSPVSEPSWWLQRIEPVSSSSATYFCGVGNSYGYGGIQQVDGDSTSDPPNGKVIFSIWDGGCDQDKDPDCDPTLLAASLICGTGVTCADFGGEGTGRKSYFSTDQVPIPGQEYFMAVHAEPTVNDRVIMTGYFHSEGTGWRLLSKIDTNQSGKPWSLSGLYSFVEQWTEGNTLEPRDAKYGPSFISGDDLSFEQIIDAKNDFGTPENHEHVNGYYNAEGNNVGIVTGGDIEPVATQYQIFSYNKENSMPAPLEDFIERIDCLVAGTTADEIDDCLTEDLSTFSPTSAPTSDGDGSNVKDVIKVNDSGAAAGLSPPPFNLILCAAVMTLMTLTWLS